MTTEAPRALPADACPEPEQLAAYIDGALPPAERTLVERHLAGCRDCRDIVGHGVAVLDEMGGTGVPAAALAAVRPARSRRTWIASAAVLAAAAAVVLMVRLQRPSSYYVPEMAALVRVDTPTRAVEGRLAGFPYAPPPVVTRGSTGPRNLELTAAAEKVRAEIGSRGGAGADAARGVTFLLSADADRAIEALERATAGDSASAKMFSDLAAAYLQRGDRDDPARARAAADKAIALDPSLLEGSFNHALALERLGRTSEALQAWQRYAAQETDAAWVAEARRNIARLSGGA